MTTKREYVKRSISTVSGSGGGDKEARKRARKSSESATQRQRRDSMSAPASKEATSPGAKKSFDAKQIRANALKGIREALRIRITKAAETKCTNEDLDKVWRYSASAVPRSSYCYYFWKMGR